MQNGHAPSQAVCRILNDCPVCLQKLLNLHDATTVMTNEVHRLDKVMAKKNLQTRLNRTREYCN
jgi:hypothetical protein